ncbi:MAG: NAD(P)-dependent oxidoreductase [Candidatus Nanohalobium sp.]
MEMEKVAWFDTENWERDYLEEKEHDFQIEFFEESLTPETAEKVDDSFDAVALFVQSQVTAQVLEEIDVEVVACRSTGYDHVNLEKASEQSIKVANVPEYGATTVAEHTFGLILTISRRINEAIDKVEDGSFDHRGLKGFDLQGKTLGVIGTGSIGQEVIRIADGFNMNIVASDPYPDKELESRSPFMYVSKDDLLEISDIVTLHAPLTDGTHHMISEDEFQKMDDTVIINTSRGALIDTEALIEALENGNVSRAGLDVLEDECIVEEDIEMLGNLEDKCDPKKILEDHMLMERDDVIVTPHNAFNSREALQRIEDQTIENLEKGENFVN